MCGKKFCNKTVIGYTKNVKNNIRSCLEKEITNEIPISIKTLKEYPLKL